VGYLDKQSRVIDVVLTERGRKLFATGQLDFAYFGLFDDCIDYDPLPGSGSFGDDDREAQIEATPIPEAPFIRDVRGTVAPMEPTSHVFTASPGYTVIPTMLSPADGDVVGLMADQRREGGTYRRTGTSIAQIDLEVVGEAERGNPGFIVRVLSSGSNGLQPLPFRRDLDARRAADPFIAVAVDGEGVIDRLLVRSPDSQRVADHVRVSPRKR
jgi:hypothetical protein